MDVSDRLSRHAPHRPDPAGLADARALLDEAIEREGTAEGTGPRPTAELTSRSRARRWRVGIPVAAAVALGLGFALWPDPVMPSAFADWSATPLTDRGPDDAEEAAAQCRDLMASGGTAPDERAAAQDQAAARAEAEVLVAYTAWDGSAVAVVAVDLAPAVVDARGSWQLVVLNDAGSVEGRLVQVECLLDAQGRGTADVSLVTPSSASEPIEMHEQSSAGWNQLTGQVAPEVQRVVVRLSDGQEVEATLSDTLGMADDPALTGGSGTASEGSSSRYFAAWWPTGSDGPSAAVVLTYDSTGLVTEHEVSE